MVEQKEARGKETMGGGTRQDFTLKDIKAGEETGPLRGCTRFHTPQCRSRVTTGSNSRVGLIDVGCYTALVEEHKSLGGLQSKISEN